MPRAAGRTVDPDTIQYLPPIIPFDVTAKAPPDGLEGKPPYSDDPLAWYAAQSA